jgi:hypothetical protein
VEKDYDVFEVFPDHSLQWRTCVSGIQVALATLRAIGQQTVNECFAIELNAHEIIGRVNESMRSQLLH